MSVADIGSALESAMTEISVDGLTGDSMTWQATGEVSKAPKAVVTKTVLIQQCNRAGRKGQ